MPDERTNSTITWFNSPTRGNQATRTIVDMLKVGQWYGKHDETTAPNKKVRYRPAVKFRKIDKALLERLQTGTSNMDKTVLAQEEAMGIQDDDSDDEEPSAEESLHEGQPQNNSTVGGDGRAGELKLAFAIDPQIDINSRALLDMISEEAVVADQPAHVKTATNLSETSIDEACDDW
ncbi:hypothetical protein BYT27DRAFT_7217782 [Phlegmacium glaucopus]|nr:hypothetical protein BYT27DRAFT_7217782 [Phlegmacium glaucopus]